MSSGLGSSASATFTRASGERAMRVWSTPSQEIHHLIDLLHLNILVKTSFSRGLLAGVQIHNLPLWSLRQHHKSRRKGCGHWEDYPVTSPCSFRIGYTNNWTGDFSTLSYVFSYSVEIVTMCICLIWLLVSLRFKKSILLMLEKRSTIIISTGVK